jgi:hypothetical protein
VFEVDATLRSPPAGIEFNEQAHRIGQYRMGRRTDGSLEQLGLKTCHCFVTLQS